MEEEGSCQIAREVSRVYQTFVLNAKYSNGKISKEELDKGLEQIAQSTSCL